MMTQTPLQQAKGETDMELNMPSEWLLRMAEKEANGIVSADGLPGRIEDQAQTLESSDAKRSAPHLDSEIEIEPNGAFANATDSR